MAPRGGPAAAGQQLVSHVVPRQQLFGRQPAHPDRRQLDRQRQPVQPPAQHRDGLLAAGRHGEVGRDRRRALHEQGDRVVPGDVTGRKSAVGGGHRQRRHPEHGLPVDPQRFPAGGQHPDVRTRPQGRVDEARTGIDQVLAVVQHDQQLSVGQVDDQPCDALIALRADPQRLHHGEREQLRLGELG
jgi:hypothetical protein